jgi:hypothetical protein
VRGPSPKYARSGSCIVEVRLGVSASLVESPVFRNAVSVCRAWQATTLASVRLIVGIPAGMVIGSLIWHQVAGGLGISTTSAIPALAVLLTIPARSRP